MSYLPYLLEALPSVRQPGKIVGPFADLMGKVYNLLFELLHSNTSAGSLGLAIIIFTLIVKLILFPLMVKQQKSSFKMQALQPELMKIRKKYEGKTDQMSQQRMAFEMQEFQKKNGVSMVSGCLPMLIQMPVFIALYQVLYSMVDRMPEGMTYQFYHLVPDLTKNPATAMGEGVLAFIPYLILMLIFAFVTFAPMLLQQKNSKDQNQKRQMLMMSGIMSLFMLWISWSAPAGVLLFWGASSIFAVIQQQLTMHFLKKKDAEEEAVAEVAPVKIDVTRKVKKPRPTKKR